MKRRPLRPGTSGEPGERDLIPYTKSHDVFEIFDIIAASPDELSWVQVTTKAGASSHRTKMRMKLNKHWHPEHPLWRDAVLALRYPRKFWRFQRIDSESQWVDFWPWWGEGLKRWVSSAEERQMEREQSDNPILLKRTRKVEK